MSFSSAYVPTGVNGSLDDDEREQKRRKVSPAPGAGAFKQPQLPNRQQQEERTDINDLGDLVVASGVDLKSEEDFLTSSFQRRRANQSRPQQQSFQAGSAYGASGAPAHSTFDLLSQNQRFPSIGQQHHGTLNQTPVPEKAVQDELEAKHKEAARNLAESQQYHLIDPFLQGNGMRYRMEKIANECSMKVPMTGLYDKINNRVEKMTGVATTSATGKEEILAAKAPSILHINAPLDPILTLLSLAANERIRGLVEDAYSLARGRQTTSDGQIPAEWEGLAKPPETPDDVNHSINATLHQVTATDRKAEEARLRKRAERKARKEREAANANVMSNSDGATPTAAPEGTPAANGGDTPSGALGVVAPEPAAKISKKELDRIKKADYANEEMQTRNTNMAASMALGGGKKYSWMSGGGNKARPPAPSRASTGGPPGAPASPGVAKADERLINGKKGKDGLPVQGLDRKYGAWREDESGGSNVQLRDWVGVLEMDGRDRKALGWALMRLGREQLID